MTHRDYYRVNPEYVEKFRLQDGSGLNYYDNSCLVDRNIAAMFKRTIICLQYRPSIHEFYYERV